MKEDERKIALDDGDVGLLDDTLTIRRWVKDGEEIEVVMRIVRDEFARPIVMPETRNVRGGSRRRRTGTSDYTSSLVSPISN